MLNSLYLFILVLLIPFTGADVSISSLKSTSYSASDGSVSIPLSWIESNTVPELTSVISYTFVLCSGPNANIHGIDSTSKKVSASSISDYSYSFSFDASAGANGVYYVQIYAQVSKGYTIHYTNRFNLTGMTGSYQPSGNDASPPGSQISLDSGTAVTSINSKSFSLPYLSQTGSTRFAPMQTQPGSTVTKAHSLWQRQHATSAVTYFTSINQESLSCFSTLTPGWSYIISSGVNWASPAPSPTEWYAASARLTKSLSKLSVGASTATGSSSNSVTALTSATSS